MGIAKNFDKPMKLSWENPQWWGLLITFPWMIGLVWCLMGWAHDKKVATREQIADAIIRSYHPENKIQNEYEFFVNGKSYTGLGSMRPMQIGQHISVYYDTLDPAENAPLSFTKMADTAITTAPFFASGVAAFAGFIFLKRRHYARRKDIVTSQGAAS